MNALVVCRGIAQPLLAVAGDRFEGIVLGHALACGKSSE